MKLVSFRYMRKLFLLLAGFFALMTLFWVLPNSRGQHFEELAQAVQQMGERSNVAIPSFISQWREDDPFFLLVVVVSPAARFDQRMTIRQTWGTVDQRKDTEVVFLLDVSDDGGIQERVTDEGDLYDDVVQLRHSGPNPESTALAIIQWVSEFRPQTRFVLKIADDCFLNPFNLFTWLVNVTAEVALFDHDPVDNPPLQGSCPAAISQPSYLMTGNAIAKLKPPGSAWTTEKLSSHLCDQMAQIPVFHQSNLNVVMKSSICESEASLTMTNISTNSMRMLWWFVNDEKLRGSADNCLKSKLFETDI